MMIARRYMKLQFHLLRCLYLNTNETYKEGKMAHIVKICLVEEKRMKEYFPNVIGL